MNRDVLDRIDRISGFGQTRFEDGYIFRPACVDQVKEVFALAAALRRKVVLRGAGRSYGDAAIAPEAFVLDICRMNRVLAWDANSGVIEVEGGATIETLWRHCIEDGWWPPVVSGTMYPTIAGALAMNIHGKNNFCAGTIGEHVVELDIVTAGGSTQTLTPKSELFFAVISGFGMLGAIVRVKLQMKRVQSGSLKVLAVSPRNWDEQLALFEQYEHNADYMVSWVDCFGKRAGSGRGQFHAAWYAQPELPDERSLWMESQDLPDTILGLVPKSVMWRFLKPLNNRQGMRLINAAKYLSGLLLGNQKFHDQSLVAFSFLLDYVPEWRKAYLPDGFIQYQSFVPKESAKRVFRRQVELQQEAKLESFLGVLKRHRPDRFLFSHAVDGYSFAMDFKVRSHEWDRLQNLCHRMNDIVLDAGGRFYFAKDSTLRRQDVWAFLGEENLANYLDFRTMVDPQGILTSSLADRLGLSSP